MGLEITHNTGEFERSMEAKKVNPIRREIKKLINKVLEVIRDTSYLEEAIEKKGITDLINDGRKASSEMMTACTDLANMIREIDGKDTFTKDRLVNEEKLLVQLHSSMRKAWESLEHGNSFAASAKNRSDLKRSYKTFSHNLEALIRIKKQFIKFEKIRYA